LITIALFVIGGTVLAYLLTNFSVGQSLIYVILRKKKDDENLVERKDEDELEEEPESEEPLPVGAPPGSLPENTFLSIFS